MKIFKRILVGLVVVGLATNGWYTYRLVRFAKDSMKWNTYVGASIDTLKYPRCSTAKDRAKAAEEALENDKDYMSRAIKN
jgi:hypothetical protein